MLLTQLQATCHMCLSNDIIMGLIWMLHNDMLGASRPGQGLAGSQSTAIMGVDLASNGLAAELWPAGSVGNMSMVRVCHIHLMHIVFCNRLIAILYAFVAFVISLQAYAYQHSLTVLQGTKSPMCLKAIKQMTLTIQMFY